MSIALIKIDAQGQNQPSPVNLNVTLDDIATTRGPFDLGTITSEFSYSFLTDSVVGFVNETANDGSADGAYASLLGPLTLSQEGGIGTESADLNISGNFFLAHAGTTITFEVVLNSVDLNTKIPDGQAIYDIVLHLVFDPSLIQNDYLGITRLVLPSDQATTEANAINARTATETQYVNSLLLQVANTTIPAVAVEGSMYSAVGTSAEIDKLVIQFLPAQVENAILNGLNPQVYASEVLGLAFAFGNENGATTFDKNFGPSNPFAPATPAGDAAFATVAASSIFGSAANANTPSAILGFVSNWEFFYTSQGIPGVANPTQDQIVLAARGAAWGDAVGVALANNLGPLPGQVTNFLEDAAQGFATYSASLANQPTPVPFEGAASASGSAAAVQLIGVPATASDPMLAAHHT